MSKYHPLDVRHPANRDLVSRDFLLGPPTQAYSAPSTRARRAQDAQLTNAPTASPVPAPATPWGQRGQSALGRVQAPRQGSNTRSRRRGGWVTWVIVIAMGMYFLSQPEGSRMLSDLTRFVADVLDDTLR